MSNASKYSNGRKALLSVEKGRAKVRVTCHGERKGGTEVFVRPVDGDGELWVKANRLALVPDLSNALFEVAKRFGCTPRTPVLMGH